MSSVITPYEISVWDDMVNGAEGGYTDEKKIVVIGSDAMARAGTPTRAHNVVYTRNVNGTSTLTFDLLLKYYDTDTGTLKDNLFVQSLTNEHKVKLKLDGEWHDYLVKNIQESSDKMSITYTCKDLYINELSKNGFSLEFSTELENNQGTAKELATRILDGTDWTVGECDIQRQYVEEPLYQAEVNTTITARTMLGNQEITIEGNNASTSSTKPHYIYIFYSCVANHDPNELFQFIYDGNYASGGYPTDDDNVIMTDDNCYIEGLTWQEFHDDATVTQYFAPVLSGSTASFINKPTLSTQYRGRRLVRSQKSAYDNALGRAVGVYTDTTTGHSVYGYSETEYSSSQTVRNYIINPSDFRDESGWSPTQDSDEIHIGYKYTGIEEIKDYAGVENLDQSGKSKNIAKSEMNNPEDMSGLTSGLALQCAGEGEHFFYNGGIATNKKTIYSLTKGQEFIVKVVLEADYHLRWDWVTPYVCPWHYEDEESGKPVTKYKLPQKDNSFFDIKERHSSDERNTKGTYTYWYRLVCNKPVTYADFLNQNIGFFLGINYTGPTKSETAAGKNPSGLITILYDAEFFPYVKDEDSDSANWYENYIDPGMVPKVYTKTRYRFYEPDPKATSEEELFFLFDDYADSSPSRFVPVYDKDYQQIHSITGKESNRFNLLQDVCEAFDCWARFNIAHEENGKIKAGWKMLPTQDKTPVSGKTYWLKLRGDALRSWNVNSPHKCAGIKYARFASKIASATDYGFPESKEKYHHILALKLLPTSNKEFLSKVGKGKRDTFYIEDSFEPTARHRSCPLYYWAGSDIFSEYQDLIVFGDTKEATTQKYVSDNIKDDWPDKLVDHNNIPPWVKEFDNNESATEALQTLLSDYVVYPAAAPLTAEEGKSNTYQDSTGVYVQIPNSITLYNFDPRETYYEKHFFQDKTVSFHQYIGKENFAGFKYGVNLRDVTRTIDSEQVVTKIIVKDNSNKYAKDGYCSIARAVENPIKENFGYDFRYYINQGLLNETEIQTLLYGSNGLYTKLADINHHKNEYIEKLAQYKVTLSELDADLQAYQIAMNSASDEMLEAAADFKAATGFAVENVKDAAANWADVSKYYIPYLCAYNTFHNNEALYNKALPQHKELTEAVAKLEEDLEKMRLRVDYYTQDFFSRYTRYVQEGTWISEDYIDDSLYYYDAMNVLALSAMPKVSYGFNVIDVSPLDGYEGYKFEVGDKTFVEDPEFFGYKDGRPYHEEVIVSEITLNLDSPADDQIKIQNYKTQFEDLFQRVTAATQALKFHEGEYAKASGSFTPEGDISERALQNTMDMANWVLENAHDQSVEIGDEGIKISSIATPELLVRECNAGIILSTDGGETWNTAITGRGICATYISTGILDADKIRIMNGSDVAFGWDANGLNAYDTNPDTGKAELENAAVIPYRYVRFCKYGIYGYSPKNPKKDGNIEQQNFTSVDDVQNNSIFSLTWNGLRLNRWVQDESGNWLLKPALDADEEGNLTLSGNIYAEGGEIGGWVIRKNRLVFIGNGKDDGEEKDNSRKAFIAPYGIKSAFTGWWTGKEGAADAAPDLVPPSEGDDSLVVLKIDSGSAEDSTGLYVTKKGTLYVKNAKISGTIYADEGKIGGWHLNTYYKNGIEKELVTCLEAEDNFDTAGTPLIFLSTNPIQKQTLFMEGTSFGEGFGVEKVIFRAGYHFMVTSDGILHAAGANIYGTIHANDGVIGGWEINEKKDEDDFTSYFLGTGTDLGDSFLCAGILENENNGNGTLKGGMTGQLYVTNYNNGNGQEVQDIKNLMLKVGPHFGVTVDGTLYAHRGNIGGWQLTWNRLYYGTETYDNDKTRDSIVLAPNGISTSYSVANSEPRNDWIIKAGSKFGVTKSGDLFCTSATLSQYVTTDKLNAVTADIENLKTQYGEIDNLIAEKVNAKFGSFDYLTVDTLKVKYVLWNSDGTFSYSDASWGDNPNKSGAFYNSSGNLRINGTGLVLSPTDAPNNFMLNYYTAKGGSFAFKYRFTNGNNYDCLVSFNTKGIGLTAGGVNILIDPQKLITHLKSLGITAPQENIS